MSNKQKPEDKYFKHSNGVLIASSNAQRQGSGKKVGAPAKATKEK